MFLYHSCSLIPKFAHVSFYPNGSFYAEGGYVTYEYVKAINLIFA